MFFLVDDYEQVIYTDGKDPEYQQSIVADTAPLVTAPVIVRPCTCLRYFLSVSMNCICGKCNCKHLEFMSCDKALDLNSNTDFGEQQYC